jgi:hypothetical protein
MLRSMRSRRWRAPLLATNPEHSRRHSAELHFSCPYTERLQICAPFSGRKIVTLTNCGYKNQQLRSAAIAQLRAHELPMAVTGSQGSG